MHVTKKGDGMNKTPLKLGFDKSMRLLTAPEFADVFNTPIKKIHSEHLLLFLRANALRHPRLGLAITKKKLKTASARNQLKRQVRECFRLNQRRLAACDCVLIVKKSYTKDDWEMICAEVTFLFDKFSKFQHSSIATPTNTNGGD